MTIARGYLWATCALLGMALAACTPAEDSEQTENNTQVSEAELCAQATAHVSNCFPGQDVSEPATCNGAEAQATLDATCDELAANDGKADSACNPFLWWTCLGSGGGSSSSSQEVAVSIEGCYDEICLEVTGGSQCARVTLEDAEGNTLATEYAGTHSSVRFSELDLDDGEYTVKLWRFDGDQAETFGGTLGDTEAQPAELPLVIEGGEPTKERLRFYILQDEIEKVKGCADVDAVLSSSCGGEPLDKDETEWGWFVRVEGKNDGGEYSAIRRSFFYFQEMHNTFYFRDLMPGEYTVTFIEMDIPDYQRRNNPDYDYLVRLYATGQEIKDTFTITREDVPNDVFLGEFDLPHGVCE